MMSIQKGDIQVRKPVDVAAETGKIWVCPECNQIVTDPPLDASKHRHCPEGHRVWAIRDPSTGSSRYIRAVGGALLIGAACYIATYCIPWMLHDIFSSPMYPEFSDSLFHIVAWGAVILRSIALLGVFSAFRQGLVQARRSEPTRFLGLDSFLGTLGALSGFLLTGFLLLLANAGVVSQPFVDLYRLWLAVYGLQLWS